MLLDRSACYRIVLARDARYDGRFFTCVRSTGVYCRPVCPARTPKLENCLFVPTAAAAQEAGFRPCLRCRPECSPALHAWRGSSATVSRALALIERGALDEGDVEALAARLGVGARQLRRLFRQHLGAAPVTVAQTRRVLLAKQLLHESDLSMTEVALASGFSSVRRFNETFRQLYGRPPSELRMRRAPVREGSPIELFLPYRAPYDFEALLAFFAARAIPGIERVSEGSYRRLIAFEGRALGSIEVRDAPERSALKVRLRVSQLGALPTVIARVRQMFDVAADPLVVARELGRDPLLAPLVRARPGLRVPGAWDGFEVAVRAILGQQISVKAATRLAGELVRALGTAAPPAFCEPGLTHLFPEPARFRPEQLAALRMPRARVAALATLAAARRAEPALFEASGSLEEAVARFTALPGIGEWTAHYIAMRALRETDAFMAGDLALQRAAALDGVRPSARTLLARAERWRPFRAYAVLHLWTAEAAPKTRAARKEDCDALAS